MTTQDDLERQLWDYIYGLLDPAEARALEERITSEHDVARAYAEARLRADMVASASRLPTAPIKFETPHDGPSIAPANGSADRRSGFDRSMLWFLSSAALMLVGLIAYGQWKHGWQRDPARLARIEQNLASEYQRVIVTGPAQVIPAIDNLYTVQLQDLNGRGAGDHELGYALQNDAGETLIEAQAKTDADGNATIAVDGEQVATSAHLKVWSKPAGEEAAVALNITRGEPPFATYFTCNKAAYRPGEDAYIRIVRLPLLGDVPTNDYSLRYQIANPSEGATTSGAAGVTTHGVGNGKVSLDPESVARGHFTLSAQMDDGEQLTRQLALAGRTSLTGSAQSSPALEDGVRLQASNDAKGTQIELRPDGGMLVAGLDNKVHLEAVAGDGSPASIQGIVVDSRNAKVAEVATSIEGQGEFVLNPRGGETYRFLTNDAAQPSDSLSVPLPAVSPDVTSKLVVENEFIAAGAPLVFDVVTSQAPAQLLVAASRGEATVSQQFVEFPPDIACPATKQVTLPLIDEVAGPLRVTLYDAQQSPPRPIGDRYVVRQPARFLQLSLSEQASGDLWEVRVVDEEQRPCEAMLGVNVVTEEQSPGGSNGTTLFAAWYAAPPSGKPLEASDSKSLASWSDSYSLKMQGQAANHWFLQQPDRFGLAPSAGNALSLDELPQTAVAAPPLLTDNLPLIEASYHRAITDWRDRQQDHLRTIALIVGLASGLLLLAIAMLVILRIIERTVAWAPAASVAAGACVVGGLWMSPQFDPAITIAARPIKAYDAPPLQTAGRQSTNDFTYDWKETRYGNIDGTKYQQKQPFLESEPLVADPVTTPEEPQAVDDRPAPPPSGSGVVTGKLPEPYFHDTAPPTDGLGAGLGGGGLGGVAPNQTSPGRSLLERLATNDFYSIDLPQLGELAAADETAPLSPLGRVALHFQEYKRLPIQRYNAGASSTSPMSAPALPDQETILWDPLVKTDDHGRAELKFSLPASGRFRITIDAHGNGRIGSLQQTLERSLPATTLPAPTEKP